MTFSVGFVGLPALGSGSAIADRFNFGLPIAGRDDVADALSEHRFRKRRDVRDRTFGGVGFVLADDPERLLPAVVAPDGHAGSEPHFRGVCRGRHDSRGRAPGGPVAQLASRRGNGGAIRRGLSEGVSFACLRQGILNLREAGFGNIVRMLGDRPFRQVKIVGVLVLDEGPAHSRLLSGGERQKRNIFCAVPFLLNRTASQKMMMAVNKPKPSDGKVHGSEERRRGQTVRGRAAETDRTVNQQFSLFPPEAIGPPGLRYYPEIITRSMELDLIERIRGLPLLPFQFGAFEGKRRVASFGFKYDYAERRLQEAEEMPEWLAPMIEKVEAYGGPAAKIKQVLCTEYDAGVGIGWHRDKPHFDEVFGLSLGSACKFRFRRKGSGKWKRFTLDAEPRSLYIMTGESRHAWEHSIPPVEEPRYSITFRSMAN